MNGLRLFDLGIWHWHVVLKGGKGGLGKFAFIYLDVGAGVNGRGTGKVGRIYVTFHVTMIGWRMTCTVFMLSALFFTLSLNIYVTCLGPLSFPERLNQHYNSLALRQMS